MTTMTGAMVQSLFVWRGIVAERESLYMPLNSNPMYLC